MTDEYGKLLSEIKSNAAQSELRHEYVKERIEHISQDLKEVKHRTGKLETSHALLAQGQENLVNHQTELQKALQTYLETQSKAAARPATHAAAPDKGTVKFLTWALSACIVIIGGLIGVKILPF